MHRAIGNIASSRVVFRWGCGRRCLAKSYDLMANNRISIGKMAPGVFFTFSGLIQIHQLIFGSKKFRHIIATESSIIYC